MTPTESAGGKTAILGDVMFEISMRQDAGRVAHDDPASVGEPSDVVSLNRLYRSLEHLRNPYLFPRSNSTLNV